MDTYTELSKKFTLLNMTIEERIDALGDLGLFFSHEYDSFIRYGGYNMGMSEVKCDTDDEFMEKLSKIEQAIKERENQA